MKDIISEYWVLAMIIGILTTVSFLFFLMIFSPTKQTEFQNGYAQGMHHAMLYVRTTGEWPSYGWRHEHYNDDLQTEQDIWNTLAEGSE